MDNRHLQSPEIAHCPICATELDRRSACFLHSVCLCATCMAHFDKEFLIRRLSFLRAGQTAAKMLLSQGLLYWVPVYTPLRDGMPSWLYNLTPAQRDTVLVDKPGNPGPFDNTNVPRDPPYDVNDDNSLRDYVHPE